MGKPREMQQTTSRTLPTFDSAFGDDFTVLPTFVPTVRLELQKNSGKNTRKSADTLPSLQVPRGLECSHFFTTSKCVRVRIPRMMFFNYLRTLCWASYRKSVKYKVKIVVQRNGKPTILTVECDKICPAGKSGGWCRVMVVIWKMNEMSRNKKVQPTDNRSCTSKPRKLGISGKRTVQHKPSWQRNFLNPAILQTSREESVEVSIPRWSTINIA